MNAVNANCMDLHTKELGGERGDFSVQPLNAPFATTQPFATVKYLSAQHGRRWLSAARRLFLDRSIACALLPTGF